MNSDHEKAQIGTTDPSLALIVSRLVAAFHPEKVYLFGSHARGEAGPDSDYDLMLIMPDTAPPDLLDPRLAYKVLRGTGIAADVLLWRRANFERRLHLRASLPATIEAEGKILYAA